MDDEVNSKPEIAPEIAEAALPPNVFEFLTKNFALVSAIGGLTVLLGSTIFLFGYLLVFDWRLIWVIEYSDVLKFALVIFGFLTGMGLGLQAYVQNAYTVVFGKEEIPRKLIILGFTLSFVGHMLHDETSSESYYALHIFAHISVLMLGGLTAWSVKSYRDKLWQTQGLRGWMADAAVLVFALSIFGQTFGYYTRDMSGFKHDVFLKDRELKDAGVIMITTHHSVLYIDGKVIIAPSADVSQIVSKSGTKQ